MNNYIQIYKDVLDPSYCNDLIHRFEKNKEHHEAHDQGPMSFTQINFNQHLEYQEDVTNYQMFTADMLLSTKKIVLYIQHNGLNNMLLNKLD